MERVSPKDLFCVCRPLVEEDSFRSHYLNLAYRRGLDNYRLLDMSGVFQLSRDVQFPDYVLSFLSEGECLVIANRILSEIPYLIFRSLADKKFLLYGSKIVFPYGFGTLDVSFRYGDWVVLVEGPLDRDSLVDIYPNVVAVLSSSLSGLQIEVLSLLTDKFVLAYDNDPRGREGVRRDSYRLSLKGCVVRVLEHPSWVKDPGCLAELEFQGQAVECEFLRSYYSTTLSILFQGGG